VKKRACKGALIACVASAAPRAALLFVALLSSCATTAVGRENVSSIADTSTEEVRPNNHRLSAIDLNLYGLSYHPDRETMHRLHLDNEINTGLGLRYELTANERGMTFVEAGTYRDSGRHRAKFSALGYQWKLGERWRFGGGITLFNSRTYNGGKTFIGALPLLTYDLGWVKLNAIYSPKFRPYNLVDTFGFYLSIPLGRWAGPSALK
jgi:hypothetical protein